MNTTFDNWRLFTLNVGRAVHEGDWNWPHVRSPFARLYYVEEGRAEVVIHGETDHAVELRPGHVYLIPPFTDHSDCCSGHFVHYYIHVYEEPQGDNLLGDLDFPFCVEADEVDAKLFRKLADLNPFLALPAYDPRSYDNHATLLQNLSVNRRRELFNKVESRGILYMLMSRFMRDARPKSDIKDMRIMEAVRFMKEHIDRHLTVEEIARVACLSKDHFIRRFREEVGETPNAYMVRRKIERAELLLVTTDMTVKEIAGSLDYVEPAYFNRVFLRCVGCSPLKYREQGS